MVPLNVDFLGDHLIIIDGYLGNRGGGGGIRARLPYLPWASPSTTPTWKLAEHSVKNNQTQVGAFIAVSCSRSFCEDLSQKHDACFEYWLSGIYYERESSDSFGRKWWHAHKASNEGLDFRMPINILWRWGAFWGTLGILRHSGALWSTLGTRGPDLYIRKWGRFFVCLRPCDVTDSFQQTPFTDAIHLGTPYRLHRLHRLHSTDTLHRLAMPVILAGKQQSSH